MVLSRRAGPVVPATVASGFALAAVEEAEVDVLALVVQVESVQRALGTAAAPAAHEV